MRITSVDQIDFPKYDNLAKNRGYGILHLGFWYKIEQALKNNFIEIYQCDCGEIFYVTLFSKKLFEKNGKILCKKCIGYKNNILSFKDVQLVDELIELTREYNDTKDSEKSIIFDKIKSKNNGLFPTNNFSEFSYAINKHQRLISQNSLE